jgi:hypothetical protein
MIGIGMILREAAGWLLLLIGLYTFRLCLSYLNDRKIVEGFIVAMMGFFIFRGGLYLLRVAIAARALIADRRAEARRDATKI